MQGVFTVDFEKGLTLAEVGEGVSVEDIKAATKCNFKVRVHSTVEPHLTDTLQRQTPAILWTFSECPDCMSIDFNNPLNSGHPAILYNGHLFWSRSACTIANNLP